MRRLTGFCLDSLVHSPFAFQDRVTCLALTRACINQCTLGYRVQFIGRCLALSPLISLMRSPVKLKELCAAQMSHEGQHLVKTSELVPGPVVVTGICCLGTSGLSAA